MAIIVFQHAADVGPGRLGVTLRDYGFKMSIRRLDLPLEHPRNQHALEGFDKSSLIPKDFDNVHGVVSLGGPQNVGDDHAPTQAWMKPQMEFLKAAHERQVSLIGICLGSQMIAAALGGQVGPMERPEIGFHNLVLNPLGQTDTVLSGMPWSSPMYQTHGYEVKSLPPGATVLGSTKDCKVQAYRAGVRTYGFQFHPEFDRSMIEGILPREGDFLARTGQSESEIRAQLEKHYPRFSVVADRLCVNLATYLFPLQRKMTA
jgi:GMP synthase (glutamine-hydrolysing)